MGNNKYFSLSSDKKIFEISFDVNKITKGTIYMKTLEGKIDFRAITIIIALANCDNTKDVSLFPFMTVYVDKPKNIIVSKELLKNIISLRFIKDFKISSGKLP